MYQVIVKGNTLVELKKAVKDVYEELNGGVLEKAPKIKISKDMSVQVEETEEVYHDITPSNVIEMSDPRANFEEAVNNVAKDMNQVDVTGDLDSEGRPWDSRIHSSSKEKVGNGTWRNRRGVDKDLLAKVKAEYRGATQQPVTSAPVITQPAIVQPVVQVQAAQPVVAPPIPMMNGGHTLDSFKSNFPMVLGTLITQGKVTPEYVNTLKDYFKVDQIWNLSDAQKAECFESFAGYGLITKVG